MAAAVVLVVEDDEPVRVLAESILEQAGFDALTAKNAAEGLAIIEAEVRVDLLFTDLEMDGDPLQGTELAAAFRKVHPELPVVYTSGGGVTDGTQALFVPFSSFIRKPYTVEQLTNAIASALKTD